MLFDIPGAAVPKLTGTATAADVLSGKTFYNTNSRNILTGTLVLPTTTKTETLNLFNAGSFNSSLGTISHSSGHGCTYAITSNVIKFSKNGSNYNNPQGAITSSKSIARNGYTRMCFMVGVATGTDNYNPYFLPYVVENQSGSAFTGGRATETTTVTYKKVVIDISSLSTVKINLTYNFSQLNQMAGSNAVIQIQRIWLEKDVIG